MKKRCPKCNAEFECKSDDIANCACSTVKLTSQAYQYVSENYSDCLCVECLKEIKEDKTGE